MSRVIAVLSVFVLYVNDHALKRAFPGFVTGKLSDVAGMIFFPVLLTTLIWALVPANRRTDRAHDSLLIGTCIATALVFTLTKTTVFGNDAYGFVWGAMQWPLRALCALAVGHPLPALAHVRLVRDPSDVLAVFFVVVGYFARRHAAQPFPSGPLNDVCAPASNDATLTRPSFLPLNH